MSSTTELISGTAGGEAVEAGARRAVASRAAARAAQQGGPRIGRAVAQRAAARATGRAAGRAAAAAATRTGARVAAKAALGPVGWAAIGFDVASMGLDIWDPLGFGTLMKNHDLRLMQADYEAAYQQAYDEAVLVVDGVEYTGATLPADLGGPLKYPQELRPAWPEQNDLGEFVDPVIADKHMRLTLERLASRGYDLGDAGNTFEAPPRPGQPNVSFAEITAVDTNPPLSARQAWNRKVLAAAIVGALGVAVLVAAARR